MKKIGELLYLDSGTLTPMLKRMEALNLLKRVRSSEDERQVLIELTVTEEQLREDTKSLPEKCIPHFGLIRDDYTELLSKGLFKGRL